MEQETLLTQSGRDLYLQFERRRRARLSYWLSLTNAFAFALFFLLDGIDLITRPQDVMPALIVIDIVCGIFVGVSLLGHWLSRLERSLGAAVCVLAPVLIVLTVYLVSWVIQQRTVDTRAYLGTAGFLTFIAIAALLGNLTLMFITTAVTTAITLFVTVVMPLSILHLSPATYLNAGQINNIATSLLLQWGLTFIMTFALGGYRRTLQDLGDVRVQFARAKALDDLKDQFITSINHELRNPVMAMQGYLDILEMSAESASREKIQQLVARSVQAGDSLRRLLTSILDARRLDQGAADFIPERVPIRPAIDAAIAMIDPAEVKGDMRDLTLKVAAEDAIWGEPVRLQQILTNLLSNAVKYSQPGTPIEVSSAVVQEHEQVATRWGRAVMQDRAMIEIRIRDYGFGIPAEQIPLLFQRFVRLPRDLASNIIGNGLGLHLCRVLAEAMGGRIWVESTGVEGEGSTFILRLPLPPQNPSDIPLPADGQREQEQAQISVS